MDTTSDPAVPEGHIANAARRQLNGSNAKLNTNTQALVTTALNTLGTSMCL